MSRQRPHARNFFLNEQHELSREERSGGGRVPNLAPIEWAPRQLALSSSLKQLEAEFERSKDPARAHRYYMQVNAEDEILKVSKSKKRANQPQYSEAVDYSSATHSRAISRLGVDVLDVTDAGDAIVHVAPDGLERLSGLASRVATLGKLEQSRWALVKGFSFIPTSQRVDERWLKALARGKPADAVIELQPLLRRLEADEVIRAITDLLGGQREHGIRGAGTDFSGRMWLRGSFLPRAISRIASMFFSVQSIHQPLETPIALASKKKSKRKRKTPGVRTPIPPVSSSNLPAVGVVDGGIPDDHLVLGAYRRGTFQHPDCHTGWLGPHGSLVASRLVFGNLDFHDGLEEVPAARAAYLDIRVATTAHNVDDKAVVSAITQCVNAYADVRVFNLSFSDRRPIDSYDEVERREKLRITQDLDNLAFARDILLIVAAGNSEPGQIPTHPYPTNHEDPDWRLGHWACSFNALTCGSFVDRPRPQGVAGHAGAPSPFCKVGPGIEETPVPDLSAPGGDVSDGYRELPGLGVFGCNEEGDWEDHSGTSFSAPLLALQCARALESLKLACPRGTKLFSATAKAFLALTAVPADLPAQYEELASRTLGYGEASSAGLSQPDSAAATFIWQGELESTKDVVKLSVPIPYDWVTDAEEPVLELVVAWDTPVNAALQHAYASRDVTLRLRPSPDARAVNSRRAALPTVAGYPLRSRHYDLRAIVGRLEEKGEVVDDEWVLEVFYEQAAEYCAGLDFTPTQRVGVAFALRDLGDNPTSPQEAVQALPVAESMVRLSEASIPVRAPVVVTAR